jgi:hypothetical protein
MKKFIYKTFIIVSLATVSCEKYLEKAPEAMIAENDAFSNWNSFQGFVEEMYWLQIPYNCNWYGTTSWRADECLRGGPVPYQLQL